MQGIQMITRHQWYLKRQLSNHRQGINSFRNCTFKKIRSNDCIYLKIRQAYSYCKITWFLYAKEDKFNILIATYPFPLNSNTQTVLLCFVATILGIYHPPDPNTGIIHSTAFLEELTGRWRSSQYPGQCRNPAL